MSQSQPTEANRAADANAPTASAPTTAPVEVATTAGAQQHPIQQQQQRLAEYMSTMHQEAAASNQQQQQQQDNAASAGAAANSDVAGAAGVTNTTTTTATASTPTNPNEYDDAAPPPPYDETNYKVPLLPHGKLPTYEEVEQEKADNSGRQAAAACLSQLPAHVLAAMPTPPDYASATGQPLSLGQQQLRATIHCPPGMRVIAIHPIHPLATAANNAGAQSVGGHQQHQHQNHLARSGASSGGAGAGGGVPMDPESLVMADDAMLGTDSMFLAAFLLTFIFNWMGFLLITCACHNIAARYGALAGFGLSLAKWTLIVKNSTAVGNEENAWLWWLIMGFGFLICVRATVQYVSIKKSWRRMTVASAERMLVYDN